MLHLIAKFEGDLREVLEVIHGKLEEIETVSEARLRAIEHKLGLYAEPAPPVISQADPDAVAPVIHNATGAESREEPTPEPAKEPEPATTPARADVA